jgi:2-dehydropantoate 2-reductase
VVAVKAWQVPEVAPRLRPLLGAGTAVLPLQNGVEAADQLAAALGRAPVLGAVCKIICEAVEPGRVRHRGAEPHVALGELDGRRSERVDALCGALGRARVKTEVPADVVAALWEKFVFITAVSGLGAVTRSPLGVLRALPETRGLLEQAMREVVEVASGLEIRLPAEIVERTMAFVDRLPEDATASMQRDVMEGRPSELESQNGAVVRLGERAGVATPFNRFLHHCLLPMERRARSAPWS